MEIDAPGAECLDALSAPDCVALLAQIEKNGTLPSAVSHSSVLFSTCTYHVHATYIVRELLLKEEGHDTRWIDLIKPSLPFVHSRYAGCGAVGFFCGGGVDHWRADGSVFFLPGCCHNEAAR